MLSNSMNWWQVQPEQQFQSPDREQIKWRSQEKTDHMHDTLKLQELATQLLKELISTPSFSKEENDTAELITDFFTSNNVPCSRVGNNIYARNKHYDPAKKSVLLNSHHDTVKPNKGYTIDPFKPVVADGKLHGLGSNDAGGCLVSLAS